MHMQLNEHFIVDKDGNKLAVVIPFAQYLALLEMLRNYNYAEPAGNDSTIKPAHSPSLLNFLSGNKPSLDVEFPDIDTTP